jgi:hypothetical protein
MSKLIDKFMAIENDIFPELKEQLKSRYYSASEL